METPSQITNVLVPNTQSALADLLKDLHCNETTWIPSGLGTRIHWGPILKVPSQEVSVKALNQIIEYAKDDLTITVQAGMPLSELQEVLAQHKQWINNDWPWRRQTITDTKTCGTIGG